MKIYHASCQSCSVVHAIHIHHSSSAVAPPYFMFSGVSVRLLPFRYSTRSFLGHHRRQCRVNCALSLSTVPQCPGLELIISQLLASSSLAGSQYAGSVPTFFRFAGSVNTLTLLSKSLWLFSWSRPSLQYHFFWLSIVPEPWSTRKFNVYLPSSFVSDGLQSV